MIILMNITDKTTIKMRRLMFLIALISISAYNLYPQIKIISGRIISDDLAPAPGISIFINDSIEVGITDMEGFFKISINKNIKEIKFIGFGFEPAIIELVDNCDIIEIVMMYAGSYDFISLKRAYRKRRRKFKKLPKIHKLAYEKGIFKTRKPCYVRKFR